MKIKSISALLGTVVLASAAVSCSDDDNYVEANTTNECIITSAMLGTLNRTMHTLNSKGEDSTFTVSVTGSLYPMNIDQERLRIYNTDSLPYGTDATHVVFSTMHSVGTISLISKNTGNDTIFSLNDSIDFSQPRNLRVHATNGVSKRTYQVFVNVHQEEGDSTVWHKVDAQSNAIADLLNTRCFAIDNQLYLFGEKDGQTILLTTKTEDYLDGKIAKWDKHIPSMSLNTCSVVRFNGSFYALDKENKMIFSIDGITWKTTTCTETFNLLVGAGTQHLIAIKNGDFYSSTDAVNWEKNNNDMPELVPSDQVTATFIPSQMDKTFETLVVVGHTNGTNVVWTREIDLTGAETFPWVLLPASEINKFNLPQLQQPILNRYDGVSMLAGLTEKGQFAPIYMSRDNGRTWKVDQIKTPGAKAGSAVSVTVDKNNFVWLFCGKTGEVWRGRINRLGWTPVEDKFERSNHLK